MNAALSYVLTFVGLAMVVAAVAVVCWQAALALAGVICIGAGLFLELDRA